MRYICSFFRLHDTATPEFYTLSLTTLFRSGEALKDTAARTLPFFERCIMGDIRIGKNVLVVAHGKHILADANIDRKSTRLNSSHEWISYAVFCLKKKTVTTGHQNLPLAAAA